MHVTYIGRHNNQYSADDEGAIVHALRQLGCEVLCVPERGHNRHTISTLPKTDIVLFNHWGDCELLRAVDAVKVCWCFDLIDWQGDPSLTQRCEHRKTWAARALKVANHCFFTDGDFAAKHNAHWLPQGADERIVGAERETQNIDVLFTGIAQGGGSVRESFVDELKQRCGNIVHVIKGTYREELRRLIGRIKIVVAPDSPVTDNYWSNRVWNTLGFGGFMMHPYCQRLAGMYDDGKEIVFYNDREHMFKLIKWYLEDDTSRRNIARRGLERTKAQHTYTRRCEILLATVRSVS